jgi:hypothetical protein
LFFAVSCTFHRRSPLWVWENCHSKWSSFRGLRHYEAVLRMTEALSTCREPEELATTLRESPAFFAYFTVKIAAFLCS